MARTNSRRVLILLGILFLLIGQINAKVIDVNLVFYGDSVHETYILVADKIPVQMGEDYVLEVLSSAGEVVRRRELRIPSDMGDNVGFLSMRLSYRDGMEILRLLHNGQEVYSRNLLAYVSGVTTSIPTTLTTLPTTSTIPTTSTTIPATTTLRVFNCGNSICDEMENYKSCPGDCPSGSSDNYCDGRKDGKCDPDCYGWEDLDCEPGTTSTLAAIPGTTIPATTTPTTTPTTLLATTLPTTSIPTTSTTIPTTNTTSTTSTTTTPLPTTTVQPEEKEDDYTLLYAGAIVILLIAIAVVVIKIRPLKGLKKVDDGELRYWIEGKLKTGENPSLLKKALEMQGADPAIVDEIMNKIWKNSAEVV